MKQNTVRSIKNADALTTLVVAARKQGLTVNALRGSADMFHERNHKETLRDLQAIVAFDRRLPSTVHLASVKYDVEPYGSDEWKTGGTQRAKVMMDYLSFLQKAKSLLNKEAPHLELCVDVPFWWDMQEFSVTFNGKEKWFLRRICGWGIAVVTSEDAHRAVEIGEILWKDGSNYLVTRSFGQQKAVKRVV